MGLTFCTFPTTVKGAPQVAFTEGVFIDYRALDRANITPIYEFGYGLSYTTFSYSNLQVKTVLGMNGTYTPTTGSTPPAPTYGTVSNNTADYQFPSNLTYVSILHLPLPEQHDPLKPPQIQAIMETTATSLPTPRMALPNFCFQQVALQAVIRNCTTFCMRSLLQSPIPVALRARKCHSFTSH